MAAVPMKPEYGPTLGRLLAPRWQAAGRPVRVAVVLVGVIGLLGVIGLVATLLNAHYSQGGKVPFSFAYRGLFKTTPDPGGYVKIRAPAGNGPLEYSYAVEPLELPPYSGGLSGELPVYATGYIRGLKAHDRGFVLRGQGKTRVNTVPAYQVLYTEILEGRPFFGRNVLLLPERPGARLGVEIVMLASSTAGGKIHAASEVASEGVLLRPLKTFTFG
jgi:hypothetical protein